MNQRWNSFVDCANSTGLRSCLWLSQWQHAEGRHSSWVWTWMIWSPNHVKRCYEGPKSGSERWIIEWVRDDLRGFIDTVLLAKGSVAINLTHLRKQIQSTFRISFCFFSFCVTNAHLHFYDWCCQDAQLPKARIRKSLCSKVIPKVVFWNSFYYRTLAPGRNRKRRPSAKRSWRLWSALSMAMLRMSLWVVDLVDKRIRRFLGWLSGCFEIPLFLTWPSLWYRSVFVCLMRSRYVNNTRNCFNEALMQDVVSMVRGHRTTPTVSLDSHYLPSRTLFASRWGRTFSEPCRHGTRRYVSMSHYFALIQLQEICVAETSLLHDTMCIDAEQDPLAFSDPEDVRSQVEWTWQWPIAPWHHGPHVNSTHFMLSLRMSLP